MTALSNKIDFIVTIEVQNANPNGDPLADNLPRTNTDGYGIMSDVSIKRKIRNRMQQEWERILVQANEFIDDGCYSLKERTEKDISDHEKLDDSALAKKMCEIYSDVRTFGQVVTFLPKYKKKKRSDKRSIGIRGPVSINIAKSISPVIINDMQITRSNNPEEDAREKKESSTMGSKKTIEYGVYIIKGSINPYFAEKTGFSEEDAEVVKEAIRTLFVNDASSARPEGSMEVKDIYWFTHPSKLGAVSSVKIFDLLEYDELDIFEVKSYDDYNIKLNEEKKANLEAKDVKVEYIEGL